MYVTAYRVVVATIALLPSFAALCPPAAFAQGPPVTYRVIARTGDPAPGTGQGVTFATGVNFNTFQLPGIGPTGEVAFLGFLAGPGVNASNDSALFSGPGGAISLMARSGAPAADTGVNYGRLWQYDFASLPIKAGGRVLFTAPLTGRQGDDGLFVGTPGAVSLVGRSGQQAPDAEPGASFESTFAFTVRHYALNDAGQVAFAALLPGPGPRDLSSGVFGGAPGSLRLAARTGTPAPGAGGDTFQQFTIPTINAAGAVAVTATLTQTQGEGIWLGPPGALQAAVRTGAPAPGTTGSFSEFFFPASSEYTPLNDRNEVAFVARESGTNGIWAGPAGSLELVALSGRPAPGAGDSFAGFGQSPPAINNRGQVAFHASTQLGTPGIWAGSPGALGLVALEGQSAPLSAGSPSAHFSQFGPLILNDAGEIAFHAFLEAADGSFSGWSYWVNDPSGGLRLIAREGGLLDLGGGNLVTIAKLPDVFDQDPAFGSLGTESGHGWLFFNDAGQLVFRANLADGSQAIVVATVPVPEPAAVAPLLAAGVLVLRRRRNS